VIGRALRSLLKNRIELAFVLAEHYRSAQAGLRNVALRGKCPTFFGLRKNACGVARRWKMAFMDGVAVLLKNR